MQILANGQIVNISAFVGHVVFVTTTQLCIVAALADDL